MLVARATDRALELRGGRFAFPGFVQERTANEVHVRVSANVDVGVSEERKARGRAVRPADRERTVHADSRRRAESFEERVECGDLLPVRVVRRRCATVHGRDGRFRDKRTRVTQRERMVEQIE